MSLNGRINGAKTNGLKATGVRNNGARNDGGGSNGVKYDHGGRRGLIVESILADVFEGRLQAGRHLVTQDLAVRFSMSHTPVREALITLSAMGVVDLLPNRGAQVRKVTAKEVREVMQVRRALECEAVRRACGRIDLDELHALAAELRRLAQARYAGRGRFIDHARAVDSRLHDLIANSCGNQFLANELNRLKTLFRAFRDVSYSRHEQRRDFRRLTEEAHEHLAIVEALLTHNRRDALRAMSDHLRSGVKYWTRSLPETAGANNAMKAGNTNGAAIRSQRNSRAARRT